MFGCSKMKNNATTSSCDGVDKYLLFIGNAMQNLPECSIQRRHYLTELQNKQYESCETSCSCFHPYAIGIGLVLLLLIFV